MASIYQRIVLLLFISKCICDESQNEIDLITETQEEAAEKIPETEDFLNTTEAYNVTEELPEALGLRNEDERSEEVTISDTTEGLEENTLSSAENFYKDDEVFTSPSTVEMRTESTTPPSTTRAMDEEEPPNVRTESDEDLETGGQRNPKTDGSDPSQSEIRNFDPKPLPPPTSKSSTLRSWLEDSWLRPPAAVLVPLRPMALNRALAVWKDLTVEGLNLTDIVIVGYDSNGVNWRSRHNLQPNTGIKDRDVPEALSKLLLKYQGVHSDSASDGTMRALASAAKLVPYDSALFVVTDKGPGDLQRLPLALRTLVEKRLKVYTIWTDPSHPSSESERALEGLRSISQHTEGEVLPYSIQVMDVDGASNFASESEMHWQPLVMSRQGRVNNDFEDRFDTLLVRRGGGEAISLGLPVETGVTALRIYIEGAVEHAVLYPPNDAPQIDLYNSSSVEAFSPASRTEGLTPRDVYLLFPGTTFDEDSLSVIPANPKNEETHSGLVGVWHFSVRCDTCDYRLCITARGQIHLDVASNGADALKLRVTGPVASVRESLLVDEYGTELAKLSFSYQPLAGEGQSDRIDPSTELVADVELPPVKGSKVYVKIFGRDYRGEPFIRLFGPLQQPEVRLGRSASVVFQDSTNDLERVEEENSKVYFQRLNDSEMMSRAVAQVVNQRGVILTAVQIGLSTRLYGSPGDRLQLNFEVTNNREQSVRFTFGAVGELRFLTGISPYSQTILSGQTVNVVVTATIPTTAQPGVRDLVTFTAYAPNSEQVSISAYIYVVASDNVVRDTWAPEVRHNFQGSCIGRMGDDCSQHAWSAVVVVRDSGAGLLRITSSPAGLTYNNDFISGTRDEVVASYRATCCAPRMLVNAVDAYGNTNSYVVDISNYYTEAMIAAIVLGVILAIALIALIIFLICLCVRRRKESRELPSFSTSRNVS
ncbi:uncharacterized protein LOC115453643 [Manduca sexta]|nr:uncharacterized protein LOC115453643 [Manduca sexta]